MSDPNLHLAQTARPRTERSGAGTAPAALNGRVLIEQAKGILAEHRRIAIDEAFSIFRDYARGHSPKTVSYVGLGRWAWLWGGVRGVGLFRTGCGRSR
ncbi:ANTAR domain-containing protein, partial [Streptomyces sp. NPDC060085]|uniref:ANTAR domain-containing protein n=1 Tax=Streptomyces sp. NPDC060085 TaxID=3347054 RepID=UPI003664C564